MMTFVEMMRFFSFCSLPVNAMQSPANWLRSTVTDQGDSIRVICIK